MVAATSFCVVAWLNGAQDSAYGRAILAALCLSWVGDAALLGASKRAFLVGLFAFLAGHLAFAAAFVLRGINPVAAAIGAAVVVVAMGTAGRWFVGIAPPKLKGPVVAYLFVIGSMVALAAGVAPGVGGGLIALAAALFMVSDVSVGLNRLAEGGREHRWGTPLYFGAQLLFAWTVR